MTTASISEAKAQLSRFVAQLNSGEIESVIISRNGTPAARLSAYEGAPSPFTFGVAKGEFAIGDIDACNDEVAALFYGE